MAVTVDLNDVDLVRRPYVYIPVEVDEGTTRLDVVMTYHRSVDCIVDLGLMDCTAGPFPSTSGFRGWSGGARDRFFVATDDATPGYLAGSMHVGTWQVILGPYKLPNETTVVTLTVALQKEQRGIEMTLPPRNVAPVRTGAGWYRGDLHCHTFHSDAAGSPETLHAAARQAGLDFLAVADHNTISQWRHFDGASSPELLFIRAMEVTTPAGHANVFGADGWVDFRISCPGDVHLLAAEVRRQGGLLSINHDKPTIPWNHPVPLVDCMEVWQSAWMAGNWISLKRYQERLVQGMRISAIGGSDYHQPASLQPDSPQGLARPTTVLWLQNLSERDVLEAMKAGCGYVTESPSGPHLSITVNGYLMGSTVNLPEVAKAEVRGAEGDLLVWIDASGVIAEQVIASDVEVMLLECATAKGFLRAEIVALKSRKRLISEFQTAILADPELHSWLLEGHDDRIRRALSNPIYFELD